MKPYFGELVSQVGPPPRSPLGPKPQDGRELEARRIEAARLTTLLESSDSFSFVRMGDMDLGLLLAAQKGGVPLQSLFGETHPVNGTQPAGCPGLGHQHVARMIAAFEHADYVDLHERLWPIGPLLPGLKLERPAVLHRNPDAQTSYILLTWMEHEFRGYCERHRVGFCGAEAAVLEYLSRKPEYHAAASSLWPAAIDAHFHQPRDNGSNLDANLELVKEDLRAFIRETQIDTLFLSLGGGAKILCHELGKEENIRCIDFGAMLRTLCYLGSDGNRAARSTHSPFYYRLPFDLVMNAVETAFPRLAPQDLLAKAHAQVILELQRKEPGWTSASSEFEFCEASLRYFRDSNQALIQRYASIFRSNPSCILERKRFLHFCGTHRLTLSGQLFLASFHGKSLVSRLLGRGQ
jgi:hypothetical protein